MCQKHMKWWAIIKEAAILSVASILLALTVNAFSPAGIPLTSCYNAPGSSADCPFPIIDAAETRRLLQEGGAVLVDARSAEQYEAGHVPGARSLPLYQMDANILPFLDEVQVNVPLVTYCSCVTCEDSHLLAESLAEMGYINVKIFAGGLAAWREAGYDIAVN